MGKKVIVTGATGFIGTHLCNELNKRGDALYIFTRDINKAKAVLPYAKKYIEWNFRNPAGWEKEINGKDAIIHLAGANLMGKRWDDEYKKLIIESRKISTENLVKAVSGTDDKPKVFVTASAVGYYGDSGERLLMENMRSGHDFLADVCRVWEEEVSKVRVEGVRRVSIRTGVVLSKEEGALKELLPAFKYFVGGPLGSGKQWFPWIHLDDLIHIYCSALDLDLLRGPVNASSPNPVRMKEFAKTLGKIMHRPSFFKVPEFALRIAVGEAASSIITSQRVIPKKLEDYGYKFKFPHLEPALRDLLD